MTIKDNVQKAHSEPMSEEIITGSLRDAHPPPTEGGQGQARPVFLPAVTSLKNSAHRPDALEDLHHHNHGAQALREGWSLTEGRS